MAETGRLTLPADRPMWLPLRPVTLLRILIIVAVGVALPRRRALALGHRQAALRDARRSDLLLPPLHHLLRDRHRHADRRPERARRRHFARRQQVHVARLRSLSLLSGALPEDHLL